MTVPALPAASLVVIDDRPDLHVLLGRRRPGAFVGDMIVYPGGAVDDDDWRLGPALVPGATAPGLSAADAAAYLHAAIRETREEVGLFPDPNEVHDGTAYALGQIHRQRALRAEHERQRRASEPTDGRSAQPHASPSAARLFPEASCLCARPLPVRGTIARTAVLRWAVSRFHTTTICDLLSIQYGVLSIYFLRIACSDASSVPVHA